MTWFKTTWLKTTWLKTTWIDDGRWEPEGRGLSPGRALYGLAIVIAAVIVIFAVGDLLISWGQGAPIVRIFPFLAAAIVWLIGRVCRALLP
jgi:hypothetical protein